MLNEARLEERLRATFTKEGAELSGLAIAVIEGGSLVYEHCLGRRFIHEAERARDLPVEADTKFRAASISKPVTAIGAMLLAEGGRLDLHRDISDYLGFDFHNPHYPGQPVTAAMLLSHTSSVRDDSGYFLPLPWRLEDFVLGRLEGQPRLAWAGPIDGRDTGPGRYFRYSNLNYGILATVMERLSGERFDRYMRDRVLRPLGIDGGYNVLDLSVDGFGKLAALYRKAGEDGAWRRDGPWMPQVDDYRGTRPACACRLSPGLGPEALEAYEIGTNGAIFSPQGGLRISVRDLSKIARLFIGGGEADGRRFLSKESVERMMSRQWAYDPLQKNGELYSGLTRETGLGLVRTTASRDEQGGDRFLESGGPLLWGHHADAYGLLGGMAFDPVEGYGFIYIIGGTACPPEKLRGLYSSWFLWEEEIQAAILEESGHAGAPPAGLHGAPGFDAHACASGTSDGVYRTGLMLWRGAMGELGCFSLDAVSAEAGPLAFDPANALARDDELIAEATSPVLLPGFPLMEAIPSWNAETPEGSRLDVFVRARSGDIWTGWYALGQWCSGSAQFTRRSIKGQSDESGEVKTDTLVLTKPADALQIKVRFVVAADRAALLPIGLPSLRNLALSYSSAKSEAPLSPRETGETEHWGKIIQGVPAFSQMVYPDGGNVWCSPTCVAMILSYWEGARESAEDCVRRAVAGVYDQAFEGYGNWSFNAAWAGARGYDALVARFPSFARLEPFIAAGIPIVLSVSWNEEAGRPLQGAPVRRSGGHLTLLVGFDERGDPVMNEPAARDPGAVRRTYRRAELETRWLESSGGAVYIVVPRGKAIPGFW